MLRKALFSFYLIGLGGSIVAAPVDTERDLALYLRTQVSSGLARESNSLEEENRIDLSYLIGEFKAYKAKVLAEYGHYYTDALRNKYFNILYALNDKNRQTFKETELCREEVDQIVHELKTFTREPQIEDILEGRNAVIQEVLLMHHYLLSSFIGSGMGAFLGSCISDIMMEDLFKKLPQKYQKYKNGSKIIGTAAIAILGACVAANMQYGMRLSSNILTTEEVRSLIPPILGKE